MHFRLLVTLPGSGVGKMRGVTITNIPAADNRPRRNRWGLRFSLRTLLIVMTIVCLVSGFWLNRAIRQRTAVRKFYELTANRPPSHGDELVTMGYRYQGRDQYYKPIIPRWLHPVRDLIGEEAFGEVTGVQLIDTPATNEDLRYLADVPTVERVWLSRTKVTDQGIRHLLACPRLTFLTLDSTEVTDEGVAQLTELTGLESLSLSGTKITDAGLPHLAKLTRLKELWLRNSAITNEGYLRLEAALPECHIQADVPAYNQKHQQLFWGRAGTSSGSHSPS